MRKLKNTILGILIGTLIFTQTSCGKQEEVTTTEEEKIIPVSVMGDITENTLKISPNGTILEIACEDYKDTSVDVSNLSNFIKSEVDEFNYKNGEEKVKFIEYNEENGFVRTALQYSDINSYNEFNSLDVQISLYKADVPNEILRAELASENDAKPVVMKPKVSEEELAEAGYSLEDLEKLEQQENKAAVDTASISDAIATLTDATSGNVLNSNDISGDSLMMIVTDEQINIVVNSGKVRYANKYADITGENSASTLGKGKSVVVYEYEF